jgi:hypothetical protein
MRLGLRSLKLFRLMLGVEWMRLLPLIRVRAAILLVLRLTLAAARGFVEPSPPRQERVAVAPKRVGLAGPTMDHPREPSSVGFCPGL